MELLALAAFSALALSWLGLKEHERVKVFAKMYDHVKPLSCKLSQAPYISPQNPVDPPSLFCSSFFAPPPFFYFGAPGPGLRPARRLVSARPRELRSSQRRWPARHKPLSWGVGGEPLFSIYIYIYIYIHSYIL